MNPAGLTFDHAVHQYRYAGAMVPGVTQLLRPLVDLAGIPPAVLEAKRDLGTRVHEACHYFDEDDLDEESIAADVEPYLEAWKRFKADTGCKVLQCEARIYCPSFGYAGTLDRVLQIEGERWLIDLKTSLVLPMAVGPQTSAYWQALGDPSVTRRGALKFKPDGTYKLQALNGPDDWATFLSCLTLHRFKEKHL